MLPRVGFARWRSDAVSGGNRYDDALTAALRTLGIDLREYAVGGSWPLPQPPDRQRLAAMLTAEQHWLIGNIIGSAAPEALAAAVTEGLRITMLLHYFPADDPALSSADRQRLARTEAEAVHSATTIVVTSYWAADVLAMRYGRTDAVVAVPGVEPAELAAGSLRHGRPPRLLWLARLTRAKDPVTLVEALIRLKDLDWTARLVGPDTVEPDLTREVRDRLEEAGIANRVELLGLRKGDDLESVWAHTDLLVHTSRFETYAMVVSEALARGIPSIVASGTGAVEAQVVGGKFSPGDSGALADVLRVWLTDSTLRERWRTEAAAARHQLPTWIDTARIVSSALRR